MPLTKKAVTKTTATRNKKIDVIFEVDAADLKSIIEGMSGGTKKMSAQEMRELSQKGVIRAAEFMHPADTAIFGKIAGKIIAKVTPKVVKGTATVVDKATDRQTVKTVVSTIVSDTVVNTVVDRVSGAAVEPKSKRPSKNQPKK